MLDYRAWIAAALILIAGASAYLIWIYRPKATYNAQSLSAAPPSSKPAAKPGTNTLHVEGCREDFIVGPGELIEPRVVPGAPLAQFESAYGQPTAHPKDASYLWKTEEFSLTGARDATDPIHISINGQHIVETLDGVELGLDSFGRIFGKMQDKKVEIHERILKDDSNWMLIVTLDSACGRKFRSEYTRSLPRNPETDRQITSLPPAAGLDPGVLRSDIFLNKVAYDYTMQLSNGSNQSTEGIPSEHE